MKKKNYWIIILISVSMTFIFGLMTFSIHINNEKEVRILQDKLSESNNEIRTPDIYFTLDSLTIDSFYKKIESNDSFLIYLGRPTCSDCNLFEPSLIDFLHENPEYQDILYLNVEKIKELDAEWVTFTEHSGLSFTPTFARYESGQLTTKIEWNEVDGFPLKNVVEWIEVNHN